MTDARSSAPTSSPAPCFVRPTFEQLYASARGWLRALDSKDVDAEDLLHDVTLIAYRGLDHFDPSASRVGEHDDPARALRAWVVGIAWRLIAKRNRQALRFAARLRDARADIAHGAPGVPSAEHVVAVGDRRRILLSILATVPRCRAEVLVLHELAEMSASQIAQALGLNENTVKSRFSRGRRDALRAIQRLPPEARSALEETLAPSEGAISLFPVSVHAEAVLSFLRALETAQAAHGPRRRGRVPPTSARGSNAHPRR